MKPAHGLQDSVGENVIFSSMEPPRIENSRTMAELRYFTPQIEI